MLDDYEPLVRWIGHVGTWVLRARPRKGSIHGDHLTNARGRAIDSQRGDGLLSPKGRL